MLKYLSLIFLAVNCISLKSQDQKVKVTYQKADNFLLLTAENLTDKDYEFKFDFDLQNLKKVEGGELIKLKAKESAAFIGFELIDNNKRWYYNYTYWTFAFYPDGVLQATANSLGISLEEAQNSIIVFDKDGCSRCDRTLDYLSKKRIPHQIIDITTNGDNNDLMFGFLKENNLNLSTVTTPMVVMGGDVHFNINNLDSFMYEMKKFNKKRNR